MNFISSFFFFFQALGGLLISVLNVLTLAINDTQNVSTDDKTISNDEQVYNAALMFFSVAVGVIAICLG